MTRLIFLIFAGRVVCVPACYDPQILSLLDPRRLFVGGHSTTSRAAGTAVVLTNAFPGLIFTNPVCLASPPGETDRLFVVEKKGLIVVITNLAGPNRNIFMDITSVVTNAPDTTFSGEEGCLGMAFHPGYATNGFFYIFYTGLTTTVAGSGRHDILSRFKVSSGNPNQGNSASEVRYIVQYDQGDSHNAGDLHFGPDGYLYVSVGDEGCCYDFFHNSQHIDKDFFFRAHSSDPRIPP